MANWLALSCRLQVANSQLPNAKKTSHSLKFEIRHFTVSATYTMK